MLLHQRVKLKKVTIFQVKELLLWRQFLKNRETSGEMGKIQKMKSMKFFFSVFRL